MPAEAPWIDDSVRLRIIKALTDTQYYTNLAYAYASQIPKTTLTDPHYDLDGRVWRAVNLIAGPLPPRLDLESAVREVAQDAREHVAAISATLTELTPRRRKRSQYEIGMAQQYLAQVRAALYRLQPYMKEGD